LMYASSWTPASNNRSFFEPELVPAAFTGSTLLLGCPAPACFDARLRAGEVPGEQAP
jgi:hypothetical protein